jgi:ribosomal protein S27E
MGIKICIETKRKGGGKEMKCKDCENCGVSYSNSHTDIRYPTCKKGRIVIDVNLEPTEPCEDYKEREVR